MSEAIAGSEIILKSLVEQGVEVVFGYPGGAVLPIYDLYDSVLIMTESDLYDYMTSF